MSTVQRENVWHPYYEINLDEMDFKEKMLAAAESKKLQNPGGVEIDEIQKQLISHDQDVQRTEDDTKNGVAPSKREKGFNLQEKLDRKLQSRQARETGICPIREELYSQCFDELIRQITINCAERGFLLVRVRDEIKMTIQAY